MGEPLDLTDTKLDKANLAGTNLSLATMQGASLTNVSAPGHRSKGQPDRRPEREARELLPRRIWRTRISPAPT